ncbi:MAG: DUF92 domain-containing protein [Candidatus Marinimicrobia bacterium]|nr:DUF92 domain-containing protein [Candidatus Neomarinimicrobiota bacterium]MCH7762977.1 DUF92 domain-containing protein [Candidatus Neomarinimicrobiota bacterium]
MVIISLQLFSNEWITFGAFIIAIFLLIGIAEFFRSKLKWSPEASRKMVHVIVGLMVSICPLIFSSNIQPMTLAIIFIVLNALTLKSNKFKSMHATERTTYGTVYFPIAFLLLAAFWWEKPITLVLSMLVMTIADTLASLVGEHEKHPLKFRLWDDEKSLQGSAAMFLSTTLIIYVGTDFFAWFFGAAFFIPMEVLIGCAVFTGIAATLAEATSSKGSDNLSVPLVTANAYEIYLINYTHGSLPELWVWTFGSAVIFLIAYKLRSLNGGGTATAFIMGLFIFGAGGVQWITPILAFFILSSIMSKIGKKSAEITQKGSRRDVVQVLANGTVPMIIALVNFYHPFNYAYALFLGAIAAATADTWATEIGYFSKHNPRHILNFKTVEKGSSGGVTLLGFLGSILGAGTIALIGLNWLTDLPIHLIVLAGFVGSLVDSILGGSVQAMFRCAVCNKETERRIHCDMYTHHIRGFKWIDNDGVNFVNTIVGAMIVLL